MTAVLVLEADGVLTGGNLTSSSVGVGVISLPSTVAGFRRRIVAADSGPARERAGAEIIRIRKFRAKVGRGQATSGRSPGSKLRALS